MHANEAGLIFDRAVENAESKYLPDIYRAIRKASSNYERFLVVRRDTDDEPWEGEACLPCDEVGMLKLKATGYDVDIRGRSYKIRW